MNEPLIEDRWCSCTISYTFGILPDRIGAYRYIIALVEGSVRTGAGNCPEFGIYQVKSYMSYLQQYTKIIKMLTLKTYFS